MLVNGVSLQSVFFKFQFTALIKPKLSNIYIYIAKAERKSN